MCASVFLFGGNMKDTVFWCLVRAKDLESALHYFQMTSDQIIAVICGSRMVQAFELEFVTSKIKNKEAGWLRK